MAVPQNHQSRSRRDKRRTHDALSARELSTDKSTEETHLRHHVTPEGYYRGKKVIGSDDEE